MLYKNGKALFGHLRQNQGDQSSCSRRNSSVEITELITQFDFTDRPMSFRCPSTLTLATGATAHFICEVIAPAIVLP
ncbi:MAG: hypothetical protein ICV79_25680 [Flavisolibacter sp.]|nr:hypothetical protein [Flavisolibacter sp.]